MTRRIERINQLIKEELGKIFMEDFDLSRDILLTIMKVEITVDLSFVKIWLSVFPIDKRDEIFKIINSSKKEIRYLLGKKINLRIIPRIDFRVDESEEKKSHIEHLFKKIKNSPC